MPSKKKTAKAAAPKPFKVLTRKAAIGWMVVIFIACGWMFALGVLVGRDQAPIEYDLDAIGKQLAKLKQRASAAAGADKDTAAAKDKNQLDFYEALPENREDTAIPKRPKPKTDRDPSDPPGNDAKPPPKPAETPSADKKAPPPGSSGTESPRIAAAPTGSYSIQAASVKNKPDADRLAGKLKKRGYPAFVLTSEIQGKGTWHRVRIGPYRSKADAATVLNALRGAGMKPILVKSN